MRYEEEAYYISPISAVLMVRVCNRIDRSYDKAFSNILYREIISQEAQIPMLRIYVENIITNYLQNNIRIVCLLNLYSSPFIVL